MVPPRVFADCQSWPRSASVAMDRTSPVVARLLPGVLPAVERALEVRNDKFLHFQHRVHGPLGRCAIRAAEQLVQHGWDDLPGEAELVLQPAAAAWAPAIRLEL